MDVKSAFLYGKIEEEVYVCQPLRFEDPDFLDRVYKVEKALYGLHQAPRAWYETLSTYLLNNEFQRGKINKTLFIKRNLLEVKTASTPMETQKPLLKDKDGEEVDVHMYRLMIGSLMYLTSSRPDIMFALYLILLEKAKKSVRLMMEKLVIRENRQRVLVRKRIERIGENKNRKRAVWNKNRQSDLVSKRIERSGELKNRKRVEYIKNRQSVWNGIGVNAGDSKLMLLGINLLLLVKVNAARHNLLMLVTVNAV
ncbi:retrovirus-related pol polyprotein from transposon TNT 1-94 [Tanacetum coccineum]